MKQKGISIEYAERAAAAVSARNVYFHLFAFTFYLYCMVRALRITGAAAG